MNKYVRDLAALRVEAVATIHALEAGKQRVLVVDPQFAVHLCDLIEELEAAAAPVAPEHESAAEK